MKRLLAQFALYAVLWIALPATATSQSAPGSDREISEAVIYRDGRHVFVTSRNAKFNGHADGAWKLAGEPVDRIGTRGPDTGPAQAADGPARIAAPDDKPPALPIDDAPDRTLLDYLALGLLFFIAVWAIAYRPERSADASMKDRAEALDARLSFMDQRLADLERRARKQPHHVKTA